MYLKYLLGGFLSKTLASFDDAITRVPIIAQLTKTLRGRIAFSIGNLLAVTVAIFLAWFFSSILESFPYTHLVTSILILALATAVYFDLFDKKSTEKIEKEKHKIKKHISSSRFWHLIGSGFIVSLVTLLDDFIVLSPLFLGDYRSDVFAIIGMYSSTIIQLVVMIYLAEKIARLKHVKKIAVIGLVVLAALVYFRVF